MSGILAQVGLAAETTYGTAVTPTTFYEFDSEGLVPQVVRIPNNGLRAGGSFLRNNSIPFVQGHEGAVPFAPQSKSFAKWLPHMLGALSSTTTATDSVYTHTATVASLAAQSFTFQVGRPEVGATTADPYTYAGCKITQFELGADVNGLLIFTPTINAKSCSTSTSLASASYATSMEPFAFVGASLTIGGGSITTAKNFKMSVQNALKTDRNYLGVVHAEPIRDDWVGGTFSIDLDYNAVTHYNRIVGTAATAIHAAIVATFQAPTLAGASAYPQIIVTIPAARFDGTGPVVSGPGLVGQSLSGIITDDGTNSPVTIAYKSTDSS